MTAKELGVELAHPHIELDSYSGKPCYQHFGLTKREYYAGLAMQGLLASGASKNEAHLNAIYAVQHADALLIELAKEE
jgi:hypothetical protein